MGSALALACRQAFPSSRITALDSLRRRGSELNLERLGRGRVEFVHGDIRDPADLSALQPPPDLILECSAESSAQAGYGGSPEYLICTNLMGCFHCLELARRTGADFLFLSTSRVYPVAALNALAFVEEEPRFRLLDEQVIAGASGYGVSESFPLEGPRSLYGMTKLAGELMVQEYAHAYGLRQIINRCGLIAGPWQMGKVEQGVVALWMTAHYFGQPLSYIGFGGKGKQVRDILHVDDLADLVVEQLIHFDRFQGGLFNVGGGRECSLSLLEMTGLCRQISGNRIPIAESSEDRPADVRIYLTDARKIREFAGWHPKRTAATVLEEIYRWIRENEALLRPVLLGRGGADPSLSFPP